MGRIKIESSPELTIGTLVTHYAALTVTDTKGWSRDSTTNNILTPRIDGEILKIVLDYGTDNKTTSAIRIYTRDTPSENVYYGANAASDETLYPRQAAHNSAGDTTIDTCFVPFAVNGSLLVSCSGIAAATHNIRIYFR